jgi:hypothetical protein
MRRRRAAPGTSLSPSPGSPLFVLAPGPVRAGLPPLARRIARAFARGETGALLPPRLALRPGPDGGVLAVPLDGPVGEAGAHALLATWSRPAFAPLLALLDEIDRWRRAQAPRWADVIAPRQLDPLNGGVYGDLIREAFERCAGARAPADNTAWLERRRRDFCAAMERFLHRLRRDLRGGRLRALGAAGRVVALTALGEETHNGFERVLRVRFRNGVVLVHKARPADGERLLMRPGGLFDAVQRAPVAAGEFRLPLLDSVDGARGDGLWCEWIAPPAQWGRLRREGAWRLRGPRLSPSLARRFWHDAGALAAACCAFGVADLYAGNLRVGRRRASAEPMPYPVDPEVCFATLAGLTQTGLIADPAGRGNHHVGFEPEPRLCSAEAPLTGFVRRADGAWALQRIAATLARSETCNVVADTRGRIGPAPYLPAFARGLFDAWATLCVQWPRIEARLRRSGAARTRVLRRSSEVYAAAMDADTLGDAGALAGFDAAERAQMRRGDLPAFYRDLRGGPLRWIALDRDGRPRQRALRCPDPAPLAQAGIAQPPQFVDLALALRDLAAAGFAETGPVAHDDRTLGVRLRIVAARRGEAAFDWVQRGHRLIFRWHGDRLRLRAEPLPPAPPNPAERRALRERLLRIDRIDAALRARWAAAGFPTRGPLARELRALERAAADWLRECVDAHGWPGRTLVGARAADAACRLVQHLQDATAFQRRCLRLLRAAAAAGDVPAAQPAYLEDALCVQAGRPQRHGTKLRRIETASGSAFAPYPIRAAAAVDARRAAVGLPPMAQYLRRAQRRWARLERDA